MSRAPKPKPKAPPGYRLVGLNELGYRVLRPKGRQPRRCKAPAPVLVPPPPIEPGMIEW